MRMHLPPPPDPRELLPPFLACLPTSSISPQPPPALLPLVSPLLRQRVTFLSVSGGGRRSDGWLSLLSWDTKQAAKLPAVVERMQLEPHPVSGEIELEDVRPAKYRRLDEETLQSRLEVQQFDLLPVYVWCDSDTPGGTGPGWKLSELRSLEDVEDELEWYDTVSDANDATNVKSQPQFNGRSVASNGGANREECNDDEDDYWAFYDRTPGRGPTPAKRSPAPFTFAGIPGVVQAEQDYYARYGSEVQPAMDSHDPDEEIAALNHHRPSNGNTLLYQQASRPGSRPNGACMFPADLEVTTHCQTERSELEAPRPISPAGSNSSVDKLEEKARAMSCDSGNELAIKQHISTDVKSLFRLARASGMPRREFERIVMTELECLALLESDE